MLCVQYFNRLANISVWATSFPSALTELIDSGLNGMDRYNARLIDNVFVHNEVPQKEVEDPRLISPFSRAFSFLSTFVSEYVAIPYLQSRRYFET